MMAAFEAWLVAALLAQSGLHEQHRQEAPVVKAPGYSALAYPAPAPGSYELPPLGEAADGAVIASDGEATTLHALYDGKLVVLSFIYTSCPDVNGCPLAGFVLKQLQQRIGGDARLRDGVRLISLSFDPRIDTPDRMARYGAAFRREGDDWRFVTCDSEDRLAPILDDYDQWVQRDYDEDGNYLGSMSHILRVFLIDERGRIRNIYSPSFLHADLLHADLLTLQREAQGEP